MRDRPILADVLSRNNMTPPQNLKFSQLCNSLTLSLSRFLHLSCDICKDPASAWKSSAILCEPLWECMRLPWIYVIRLIKRNLKVHVQLERGLFQHEHESILARSESPTWAVGSMQEKFPHCKKDCSEVLTPPPTSLTPASRSLQSRKIHEGTDTQRGWEGLREKANGLNYKAREVKPAHQ